MGKISAVMRNVSAKVIWITELYSLRVRLSHNLQGGEKRVTSSMYTSGGKVQIGLIILETGKGLGVQRDEEATSLCLCGSLDTKKNLFHMTCVDLPENMGLGSLLNLPVILMLDKLFSH